MIKTKKLKSKIIDLSNDLEERIRRCHKDAKRSN